MPLASHDPAYLFDKVAAGKKILRYIQEKNFLDFSHNDLLQDAVGHNLMIPGEAARKISEPFKEEHPEISWRRIIGLRNILIHEYDDIDCEEIWEIITTHLPTLLPLLEQLMPPIPSVIDD